MADQLTQDEGGRILGPDGNPFDLGSHLLVLAKRYEEPETNWGYQWIGFSQHRVRKQDYRRVVERDAKILAESNGIPYYLILDSETVHNVSEFGYPGNWEPKQLLDVKPTKIKIYTANFFAELQLEARVKVVPTQGGEAATRY